MAATRQAWGRHNDGRRSLDTAIRGADGGDKGVEQDMGCQRS